MDGQGKPPGQAQLTIYRKGVIMEYHGRTTVRVVLPNSTHDLVISIARYQKVPSARLYEWAIEYAIRDQSFMSWLNGLAYQMRAALQQPLGDMVEEPDKRVRNG